MMELIFVIVILGILAGVAVPRFGDTKEQANIANARSEIASIRSGIISDRQSRLMMGGNAFAPVGIGTYMFNGKTYKQLNNGGLFGGVLMYPLTNKDADGYWYTTNNGDGDFDYNIGGVKVNFDYNVTSGVFTCNPATGSATVDNYCKSLTQ